MRESLLIVRVGFAYTPLYILYVYTLMTAFGKPTPICARALAPLVARRNGPFEGREGEGKAESVGLSLLRTP